MILRLVVNLVSLYQHVIIRHEGGTNLLVAILRKFSLKSLGGVNTGIQRSLHLHLVVNKQLHILVDALLVNDAVGIVLVIGILEFRTWHIHTSYCHQYGVIVLCYSSHAAQQQCRKYQMLFHILLVVWS